VNSVVFSDSGSIDHLQQYTTLRHLRTGDAIGYSTAFSTDLTYYYASDFQDTWGYDATFGRYQSGNDGWQFGISVNLPDNVPGYDGIHDDKDRSEYNLGVAGYHPWTSDISGYWPPYCTSSCTNEDWSQSLSSGQALVQVWHNRDFSDADGDGYAAWEDCNDNDASISQNTDPNDLDCDGVTSTSDCDDNNSLILGSTDWFSSYNGARFTYCDGEATFAEAQALCQPFPGYVNNYLAWVENSTANTSLLNEVLGLFSATDWWVGAYDEQPDGIWEHHNPDGYTYNFFNWGTGYPTTIQGHDCAAMNTSGDWFNTDCSERKPFICR
jgi:hypothetical protein